MHETIEYELVDPTVRARKRLDVKGRCCGRKPIVYKREPHLFCARCNIAFDPSSGLQIANWAYREIDGGFQSTKKRKVPL